ncbi:FAD-binding protein, partial [Pseudomonas sp. BGM005]|nr:FAD-binding protein [Pseudomonas sp. BG5]
LSIKAVGAGHSFTGIAIAPGVLLELDDMQGLVSADQQSGRVTLLAGTRLHRIPALLAPYGLAMENLGDIDRQSIAGAVSTGTHGTGSGFGGLATQVVGVTMVTAS